MNQLVLYKTHRLFESELRWNSSLYELRGVILYSKGKEDIVHEAFKN